MTNKRAEKTLEFLNKLAPKVAYCVNKKTKVAIKQVAPSIEFSNAPYGLTYYITETLNTLYLPHIEGVIIGGNLVHKHKDAYGEENQMFSFVIIAYPNKSPKCVVTPISGMAEINEDYGEVTVAPLATLQIEQDKAKMPVVNFIHSSSAAGKKSKQEDNILVNVSLLIERYFCGQLSRLFHTLSSFPMLGHTTIGFEYPEENNIAKDQLEDGVPYVLNGSLNAYVDLLDASFTVECKVGVKLKGSFYLNTLATKLQSDGKSTTTCQVVNSSLTAELSKKGFYLLDDVETKLKRDKQAHPLIHSLYLSAKNSPFTSPVKNVSSSERDKSSNDLIQDFMGATNFIGGLCRMGVKLERVKCKESTYAIKDLPVGELFILPSETNIKYSNEENKLDAKFTFCVKHINHKSNDLMMFKAKLKGTPLGPIFEVVSPWETIEYEEEGKLITVAKVSSLYADNDLTIKRTFSFGGDVAERVVNLEFVPMKKTLHESLENSVKLFLMSQTLAEEAKEEFSMITLEEANHSEFLIILDENVVTQESAESISALVVRKYDSELISNIEIAKVFINLPSNSYSITFGQVYSGEMSRITNNTLVIPMEELIGKFTI